MNILITGGRGFLGKVLVQKLQQEGHNTVAIDSKDSDLSKPESLQFLHSISSDFLFHLAGKTGIALSWQNPTDYYKANLDSTRHILEFARLRNIPIHYVSGYIYGNQGALPISEQILPKPNNPYAHSKWMGEEMCRFYKHCFSLPITISRPFNIYGPNQTSPFFIPRMIEQLLTQPEIQSLNLHPKRDYVFVEDVADALIAIMKKGKRGECYNIGTGHSFSCQEVIETLQNLLGTQKSIISKNQIDEIPHAQADITKIHCETGWQPKHSLQEGLAKCLISKVYRAC